MQKTLLLQFLELWCRAQFRKRVPLRDKGWISLCICRLDERDAFQRKTQTIQEEFEASIDAYLLGFREKARILQTLDFKDDPVIGVRFIAILTRCEDPCYSVVQRCELNPTLLD